MDSYAALLDNQMQGNSNGLTDYQVQSSFPQFSSDPNVNTSYGLNTSFSTGSTHGSAMDMTTYNTSSSQQSAYGNMSSNSSPSFVMPYDPPSIQQSSTSIQATPAQHQASNKAIHSCSYCGLVLSSANALMEHKRIHTGDRPFSCHICNKRFTQKAHLNIHKRTHTGEKPYACHVCHKRFAQSSHLSSHKRIHTGEKPFVCGICHIGFTQKQRLDAHLKKHLERPGQEIVVRQRTVQPASNVEPSYRPSLTLNEDSSFMQMIGHGMPYVKQETVIKEEPATVSSINTNSSTPNKTDESFNHKEKTKTGSNTDEQIEDSKIDPEKSPKITAPSFSSEGLFLHPSGYVAYGGITDNEESDTSSCLNPSDSSNHRVGMTTSASHRRKPSVVRKRCSESPVKETADGGLPFGSNNGAELHKLTVSNIKTNVPHANTSAVNSVTFVFNDIGEGLVHKNNQAFQETSLVKANTKVALSKTVTCNNQSTVETKSQSNRNINQVAFGLQAESINGEKVGQNNQDSLTFCGNSGLVKVNSRISLVNFTGEELVSHLMKRDDVHKCTFCCLIFQDAAMYHIHRNMHDKSDIRKCNMCGKLLQDKYDFTAHFLSMHQS